MISKEHRKHTHLAKYNFGNYHPNEWAILGTNCEKIKLLADSIFSELEKSYKCAYLDATHDTVASKTGRLEYGAFLECIDHQSYLQFNHIRSFNQYDYAAVFRTCDLLLVNGNHFQASTQIVVLDNNKIDSLKKRLIHLNHVQLFLLDEGVEDLFDFIKNSISGWHSIPIFKLNETEKTIDFLKGKLVLSQPKLNGLVLTGGKSVRMGYDKGSIRWREQEQRYYIADILKEFCENVFISCRSEQVAEIAGEYNALEDTFIDLGPYGGILSAFRKVPDVAWLVVACDLPLLDRSIIKELIESRDLKKLATAYTSPFDGFPEPLITIWEPKSYPVLLNYLSLGNSCPRKVLINNEVNIIEVSNPQVLRNVNTPEEVAELQKIIVAEKENQ